MADVKEGRRRKRSSSNQPPPSSMAAIAWSVVPLMLSAGLIFSIIVISSIDDSSSSSVPQHRRLNLHEDTSEESGIADNLWHRQLRTRRNQRQRRMQQQQRTSPSNESESPEGGQTRRMVAVTPKYADKHHFEECVGKTIEQCQTLIDAYVVDHPEDFKGQDSLWLDIRKIRELTDASYYKVVLRTNVAGNKVYGLFDDGMVYYPWPWKVNGIDMEIGPWSCKSESSPDDFLSPQECCAKIQDDVTAMDDSGKYLACFVEEPVGGPNNPEREDRAIVVTDSIGIVARAPVAH